MMLIGVITLLVAFAIALAVVAYREDQDGT